MFCLLVSPGPLRRALLLPGPEPPAAAAGCHVAVDIPEDEREAVVKGSSDDGVEGEETAAAAAVPPSSGHVSPACRVLAVRALAAAAVFAAYTGFAAPAVMRVGGGLRALLVVLFVVITFAALSTATLRVSEDEDSEGEEEGIHG